MLLREDELSLVSARVGNNFYGPSSLPLWTTIHGDSAEAEVSFTRWDVGLGDGERLQPVCTIDLGADKLAKRTITGAAAFLAAVGAYFAAPILLYEDAGSLASFGLSRAVGTAGSEP